MPYVEPPINHERISAREMHAALACDSLVEATPSLRSSLPVCSLLSHAGTYTRSSPDPFDKAV